MQCSTRSFWALTRAEKPVNHTHASLELLKINAINPFYNYRRRAYFRLGNIVSNVRCQSATENRLASLQCHLHLSDEQSLNLGNHLRMAIV